MTGLLSCPGFGSPCPAGFALNSGSDAGHGCPAPNLPSLPLLPARSCAGFTPPTASTVWPHHGNRFNFPHPSIRGQGPLSNRYRGHLQLFKAADNRGSRTLAGGSLSVRRVVREVNYQERGAQPYFGKSLALLRGEQDPRSKTGPLLRLVFLLAVSKPSPKALRAVLRSGPGSGTAAAGSTRVAVLGNGAPAGDAAEDARCGPWRG